MIPFSSHLRQSAHIPLELDLEQRGQRSLGIFLNSDCHLLHIKFLLFFSKKNSLKVSVCLIILEQSRQVGIKNLRVCSFF